MTLTFDLMSYTPVTLLLFVCWKTFAPIVFFLRPFIGFKSGFRSSYMGERNRQTDKTDRQTGKTRNMAAY